MKAKLEALPHCINNKSFICYEVVQPSFEPLWHYHPEYEITYIVKGIGKRLIGDSYENFTDGDFVLVPPMLPHTWISDKNGQENCIAIVIQFTPDLFEKLIQFFEFSQLEKLFSKANRGLKFSPKKSDAFLSMLQLMIVANELSSFTTLLQMLHKLVGTKSISIASLQFKPLKGNENQQRINQVFTYTQKNFHKSISLKKAASLVFLSESAFCKFFKRASGKTFSDYTNEIRIANACKLLLETDKAVASIAFESGFESLTYFNRVFLKKKKVRPAAFRKM